MPALSFMNQKGRNFASFRSLTIMVIFSAAGLLCYVTIHSLRKRSINRRSRYVLMEKNWNELNYNWSSARLIQNSLMLLKLPTAFIQYFVRQFIVEISQQRASFLFSQCAKSVQNCLILQFCEFLRKTFLFNFRDFPKKIGIKF